MTKEEAMKLLANTKVYVGEHRNKIIRKLTEIGFSWHEGDVRPEFLYITNDSKFNGRSYLPSFFCHPYKQIYMSEILDIQIDPEFKDGDVLASSLGTPFIFNGKYGSDGHLHFYFGVNPSGNLVIGEGRATSELGVHFADEKESAKLFNALSDASKVWNAEKKCVEDLFHPFDRVLMRSPQNSWKCHLYSHKEGSYHVACGGIMYPECIPYEGNEHLVGKK